MLIPLGKLEACPDERKPEAYATTWWHLQDAPAGRVDRWSATAGVARGSQAGWRALERFVTCWGSPTSYLPPRNAVQGPWRDPVPGPATTRSLAVFRFIHAITLRRGWRRRRLRGRVAA